MVGIHLTMPSASMFSRNGRESTMNGPHERNTPRSLSRMSPPLAKTSANMGRVTPSEDNGRNHRGLASGHRAPPSDQGRASADAAYSRIMRSTMTAERAPPRAANKSYGGSSGLRRDIV